MDREKVWMRGILSRSSEFVIAVSGGPIGTREIRNLIRILNVQREILGEPRQPAAVEACAAVLKPK